MTRARIRRTSHNSVTYHLPEDHQLNHTFTAIDREYFIPRDGGFVRVYVGNHQYAQVCQHLQLSGTTLIAHTPDKLLALIRREHRNAIAHKRRQHLLIPPLKHNYALEDPRLPQPNPRSTPTPQMTADNHDCAASQPGETLDDWNQRTHRGMAHVEPGSGPTCCAIRAGIDPADRARWIANEAV